MDYKASTVTGDQWQRCNRITIDNHYGQTPQITMHEELLTVVGGKTFAENAGAVYVEFNPDAVIDLLDPTTGEPLGASMTQGQIHVAMWSLYMASALARDAALAANPDPFALPT
jgi:hypothetical protein